MKKQDLIDAIGDIGSRFKDAVNAALKLWEIGGNYGG